MNYVDFTPKSIFLLTYLGYGLSLLFQVNICRIILNTEKGGNLCRHEDNNQRNGRMESRLLVVF